MAKRIRINGVLCEEVSTDTDDFQKVISRYKSFSQSNNHWEYSKGTTRGIKWIGLFSDPFDIGDDESSIAIIYIDPDDYSEHADSPMASSPTTIVIDPDAPHKYSKKLLNLLQRRGYGIKSTKKNEWARRSLVRNNSFSKRELEQLEMTLERVSDWSEI